jgi:hypothetical protein
VDQYMKHCIPQQQTQNPCTPWAVHVPSDVTDDTEPEMIGAVWLMFDRVSDRTWSGCTSPLGPRYAPVSARNLRFSRPGWGELVSGSGRAMGIPLTSPRVS